MTFSWIWSFYTTRVKIPFVMVHLLNHSSYLIKSAVLFWEQKTQSSQWNSITIQRFTDKKKKLYYLQSLSFWPDERDTCCEEELFVESWKMVKNRYNEINKMFNQQLNNKYEFKLFAPTSDFTSSDFALAESAFFINICSSSSLLLEGVLPFNNEQTAGGATVTKGRNIFVHNLNSGKCCC